MYVCVCSTSASHSNVCSLTISKWFQWMTDSGWRQQLQGRALSAHICIACLLPRCLVVLLLCCPVHSQPDWINFNEI